MLVFQFQVVVAPQAQRPAPEQPDRLFGVAAVTAGAPDGGRVAKLGGVGDLLDAVLGQGQWFGVVGRLDGEEGAVVVEDLADDSSRREPLAGANGDDDIFHDVEDHTYPYGSHARSGPPARAAPTAGRTYHGYVVRNLSKILLPAAGRSMALNVSGENKPRSSGRVARRSGRQPRSPPSR
jgi:hypothetical protein